MANVQTNKITRDKLAKIFKNQEAIKLIENLVQDVSAALPDAIVATDAAATAAAAAAQSTANTALSTANAALALAGGGGSGGGGSVVVFQPEDTPEPEIFFLPSAPAGGSVSLTTATVTVPYGSTDYVATVTDALVSPSSKVLIAPGHHAQTDANSPADIAFNVETVSAGSFTLMISSRSGTIGGPFKFTYMLG